MPDDPRPHFDLTRLDEVQPLMQPGGGPLVIEFWSGACGPCVAMAPQFDAVAEQFRHAEVTFCKVQTDRYPELGRAFQIRSVPTLMFVIDGEIVDAVVGRIEAHRLAKKVQWLLDRAQVQSRGFFNRLFGARR